MAMPIAFRNTISFFLLGMALIPITMFFAYLIFRKSIGYGFSRVTLYLPGAVGGIMLALLYANLMSSTGPVMQMVVMNAILGSLKVTDLVLTLTVPYDLGNEFMCTMGVVPWTFLVEEVPEDPDTPQTGDPFDLVTWLLAAGMILAAIAWVLWRMKRQRTAN